MNNWSGLDFFIFLIFFVNMALGMARGATKEIISMMCLSVALIFTIKFTVPLANLVNSSPLIQVVVTTDMVQNFVAAIGMDPLTASTLEHVAYCISLLICFVGAFSICEAVIAFTGFVEVFSFPFAYLNRKLGAGFGVVRGYVFTLIFIVILQHLFTTSPITGSYFYNLFQNSARTLDSFITAQTPESFKDVFKDKTLYNQSDIYKQLNQQDLTPQDFYNQQPQQPAQPQPQPPPPTSQQQTLPNIY